MGFARSGSTLLLSKNLPRPSNPHRAAYWALLAEAIGWQPESGLHHSPPVPNARRRVIIHSGGAQPTKLWPLDRYASLAARLRAAGREVSVACDVGQLGAWRELGQIAEAPKDVPALIDALSGADVFIGNDSGPGHLAALLGLPTFTFFGNQWAAAFAPVHPQAAWVEGAPCPYKPCYDSCRFPTPQCLHDITLDEAWPKLVTWLGR